MPYLTPFYTQLGAVGAADADASDFSMLGCYAVAATLAFTIIVLMFELYPDERQQKVCKGCDVMSNFDCWNMHL